MPDSQNINLKDILREEKKAKLSPVDNDFYEKAHKFLGDSEVEIDKAQPDSMKHTLLQTELGAAKINFELVLELRMSKIIREASTQKSQRYTEKHDPEHLIPDEKELFDTLYKSMAEWRNRRLNHATGKPKEPVPVPAPVTVTETVKTSAAPKDLAKDYIVVRMLKDIPTFVGADQKNYTLAKEDFATVPVVNATALISRKTAVKIEMRAEHASGT